MFSMLKIEELEKLRKAGRVSANAREKGMDVKRKRAANSRTVHQCLCQTCIIKKPPVFLIRAIVQIVQ